MAFCSRIYPAPRLPPQHHNSHHTLHHPPTPPVKIFTRTQSTAPIPPVRPERRYFSAFCGKRKIDEIIHAEMCSVVLFAAGHKDKADECLNKSRRLRNDLDLAPNDMPHFAIQLDRKKEGHAAIAGFHPEHIREAFAVANEHITDPDLRRSLEAFIKAYEPKN